MASPRLGCRLGHGGHTLPTGCARNRRDFGNAESSNRNSSNRRSSSPRAPPSGQLPLNGADTEQVGHCPSNPRAARPLAMLITSAPPPLGRSPGWARLANLVLAAQISSRLCSGSAQRFGRRCPWPETAGMSTSTRACPLVKIRIFPPESGRRACISYAARRAFDASLIPRSLFQVPAAAPGCGTSGRAPVVGPAAT